jgi:hypothetical protein
VTLTPLRIAVTLAVAAGAIQLGLTRPWRQEAVRLSDEHDRLRQQRRKQRLQLAELQARAALRAHAAALVGRSAAVQPSDAALHKVRTGVVQALDPGTSSRLEVRPGPAPAVATVALSTSGDFSALVELTANLAHARAGLVFHRLNFGRGNPGVALTLEAAALGGGS